MSAVEIGVVADELCKFCVISCKICYKTCEMYTMINIVITAAFYVTRSAIACKPRAEIRVTFYLTSPHAHTYAGITIDQEHQLNLSEADRQLSAKCLHPSVQHLTSTSRIPTIEEMITFNIFTPPASHTGTQTFHVTVVTNDPFSNKDVGILFSVCSLSVTHSGHLRIAEEEMCAEQLWTRMGWHLKWSVVH